MTATVDSAPPASAARPAPRALLDTAVLAARAVGEVLHRYFRRGDDLGVTHKGHHDIVTQADYASEAAVATVIHTDWPAHVLLGEDGGLQAADGKVLDEAAAVGRYRWLVDPLDGTRNFARGLPYFAVSVACFDPDDVPEASVILDPVGGHLFTAARGHGAFWNGRPMTMTDASGLDGSFLATGYPFRRPASLDVYLRIFRDILQRAHGVRRCGAAALDLAYTAAGIYDGFFELRLAPWDVAAGVLLVREAGGFATNLDGGLDVLAGNVLAGNAAVHRDLLALAAEHADEATVRALDAS
ncbi:MAG: inositol monophosphatase family protein [Acidobacteriota bacterium]